MEERDISEYSVITVQANLDIKKYGENYDKIFKKKDLQGGMDRHSKSHSITDSRKEHS